MSFAIFFFLLAFLSLMGVEIIEDKQPKKKNKKNQTNKKKKPQTCESHLHLLEDTSLPKPNLGLHLGIAQAKGGKRHY